MRERERERDHFIYTPPKFCARIKFLLEFRDTFSTKLPSEPALVTPLSFDLDKSKWNVRRNQQSARRQSLEKDKVLHEMTNELLQTGIVSRSLLAQAWSQAHLARKPSGKWGYCIDFRILNLLLQIIGWPLPRIKDIIMRIGSKRPKYFGKIDLTLKDILDM